MGEIDRSDQVTGDDASFYEYCAHCDDELVEEEWHPVVTDTIDDTDLALYSFCNDACKNAWVAEQ